MGLCVRRRKNESVILKTSDGDVKILVISHQPTTLNITAPEGVGVWRKELLDENNQLPARDRHPESSFQEGCRIHVRED